MWRRREGRELAKSPANAVAPDLIDRVEAVSAMEPLLIAEGSKHPLAASSGAGPLKVDVDVTELVGVGVRVKVEVSVTVAVAVTSKTPSA